MKHTGYYLTPANSGRRHPMATDGQTGCGIRPDWRADHIVPGLHAADRRNCDECVRSFNWRAQ